MFVLYITTVLLLSLHLFKVHLYLLAGLGSIAVTSLSAGECNHFSGGDSTKDSYTLSTGMMYVPFIHQGRLFAICASLCLCVFEGNFVSKRLPLKEVFVV